jgi:hypothetical protein
MTTAELFARIDAVTTQDVKTTASKFINDEDHALAAVGYAYMRCVLRMYALRSVPYDGNSPQTYL